MTDAPTALTGTLALRVAEARSKRPFTGQRPAGRQCAVEDQQPNAVCNLLRDARFLNGLDELLALDTPRAVCQTAGLNWSDHWASLA